MTHKKDISLPVLAVGGILFLIGARIYQIARKEHLQNMINYLVTYSSQFANLVPRMTPDEINTMYQYASTYGKREAATLPADLYAKIHILAIKYNILPFYQ